MTKVRVSDMPKEYAGSEGVCVWSEDESHVEIFIQSDLSLSTSIYALLHEWAHARVNDDGHGDGFYLALGELERGWWETGERDSKSV